MRILFITHDSTRTGAPLVLLYLMQWIKENKKEVEFELLDLKGGEIHENFVDISKNTYLITNKKSKSHFFNFFKKAYYKVKGTNEKSIIENKILKNLKKNDYDIIYANTVLSLGIASKIKAQDLKAKLIIHVHELDVVIKSLVPNFTDFISLTDHWICASELVRDNLINNYYININSTNVIYEFSKLEQTLEDSLGLVDDSKPFIVGGAGSVILRKGYDLFVAVANEVKRQAPDLNIVFNWVGKISNRKTKIEIEYELQKAGLQEVVFFLGEKEEPFNFFKQFDVFLMISREDPFPLVCIEVASLGKPIICFDGATGTQEILRKGGGKIVPYLSIYDMAMEVIAYARNKDTITKDSQIIMKNFEEYTPQKQSPKIYNIIKKVFNE